MTDVVGENVITVADDPCVDLPDSRLLALEAKVVDRREARRRVGHLPVAVDEVFGDRFDLGAVLGAREFLVDRESPRDVGDVARRQKRRRVQVDFRRGGERRLGVDRLAAFERLDGVHQHAVVDLKAHLGDFAALVFAQHFARASDFEVVHGEVEPRAQLLHRLDRFQALLRVLRVERRPGGVRRYA